MEKRQLLALGFLSLSALVLAACSTDNADKDDADKIKIVVATDSDTAPFTYKEGDEFKGYDIEVVEEIFDDSETYEVEFVTTAFDSILTGIDSGRYQIAANDFNYNEERAEKYLFSDPISKSNYAVATKDGLEIKSLDDLSGKSTEAITGSNYAQVLDDWNKANPDKDPIQINYMPGTTGLTSRVQHLADGKIDFILYDAISLQYIVTDQNFDLKVTGLELDSAAENEGLEYLLFADTAEGKELQSFVNKRLQELKADGSLAEISQEYFGGDFVSSLK